MFNNTVHLGSKPTDGLVINPTLVDGPTNRRTLRVGVTPGLDRYEFSIGHQASNENPGFDTQRTVVRLSLTKVEEETGKEHTQYAQLITSFGVGVVSVTEYNKLVASLVSFLLVGDSALSDLTSVMDSGDLEGAIGPVTDRLFAGEP